MEELLGGFCFGALSLAAQCIHRLDDDEEDHRRGKEKVDQCARTRPISSGPSINPALGSGTMSAISGRMIPSVMLVTTFVNCCTDDDTDG